LIITRCAGKLTPCAKVVVVQITPSSEFKNRVSTNRLSSMPEPLISPSINLLLTHSSRMKTYSFLNTFLQYFIVGSFASHIQSVMINKCLINIIYAFVDVARLLQKVCLTHNLLPIAEQLALLPYEYHKTNMMNFEIKC
jgi:hypothetical protein